MKEEYLSVKRARTRKSWPKRGEGCRLKSIKGKRSRGRKRWNRDNYK